MKKAHLELLGVQVLPIVKRSQYEANNHDRAGLLPYSHGEEKIRLFKRIVDDATKEQRKDNREQVWEVFSIHADGRFTLRSDYGYEQSNVSRSDFRVIKKK